MENGIATLPPCVLKFLTEKGSGDEDGAWQSPRARTGKNLCYELWYYEDEDTIIIIIIFVCDMLWYISVNHG